MIMILHVAKGLGILKGEHLNLLVLREIFAFKIVFS